MKTFLRERFKGLVDFRDGGEEDIEAAIYWFASHNHTGQNSELYSILSTSEFKPKMYSSDYEEEIVIDMHKELSSN